MMLMCNNLINWNGFYSESECRYWSRTNEIIAEISININKSNEATYQEGNQDVRMTIRTFNKDKFKIILEQNQVFIKKNQKPYFWTDVLSLDSLGNFDVEEINNFKCSRLGYIVSSNQLKLTNAESSEHIMQVLKCLAQIDSSANEISRHYFTFITAKEMTWLKNCLTICKNGLPYSYCFAILPKEVTMGILNFSISDNGNFHNKYASILVNKLSLTI